MPDRGRAPLTARRRIMAGTTPFEKILKHDRILVVAGLATVIAISWAWLFAGAGMAMDGVEMTRMSLDRRSAAALMAPAPWTAGYALLMFMMWWVMMLAMMLPSAASVILLAAAINRKADPDRPPFGAAGAFATGYLISWGGFCIVAVAVQGWLAGNGMLSRALLIDSRPLAAGLLIAAGLWQLSPLKQACLHHCRAPLRFLIDSRHRGTLGAIRLGFEHGLLCIGCCWFLMALLFVGGVMNLIWIAAIAAYVGFEKRLAVGQRASGPVGVLLVLGGLAWFAV